MSERPLNPRFRPQLETLEHRDAPARLVVLSMPTIDQFGAVTSSSEQVSFPSGYGFEWSARAEVTAPAGAPPGSFHPGGFLWSGIVELAVLPDAGDTPGAPASVFISSSGLIRWDLDPKTANGPSTNEVQLRAGLDGLTPWFELAGGQTDPNGSTTGVQTRSASHYVEVPTTIGGTIRVDMRASGLSDSWVLNSETIRGKASFELGIGFYMPPDLVAGPITWNRDGTVSLHYEIRLRDLDPSMDLQNLVYWLNESDAPVSEPIPVRLPNRSRGSHEIRANLGPPPIGARKLALSLNSDWFADEQDFGNNWSESEFVHNVAVTGATYDGDAHPGVIGRFFSGISVPGQRYHISISPDLATFVRDTRQMVVRLGPHVLPVEPAASGPSWDGLTYRTAVHDPGRLVSDTRLSVQVHAGGRVLAQTSALIDVEPIPAWIRASRSWSSQFQPATSQYLFSGTLFDVTNAFQVNPVRRALGLPATHRLSVSANMQVTASLDPTRSDLVEVSGTGRATGVYHNMPLFDITGPLDAAPFGLVWQVDPRNLNLSLGQVSLNLTGQAAVNHVFGAGTRSWGYFQTTPAIHGIANYLAMMSLSFGSDGRLNPQLSTASFDYRGTLQGSLGLTLPLGPNLNTALMRLSNLVGVPQHVLHQIQADLASSGSLPQLQIQSPVAGLLEAAQTLRIGGFGLAPWVVPVSRGSILQVVPNMSYSLTWAGGSFVEPTAARLNQWFALERRS